MFIHLSFAHLVKGLSVFVVRLFEYSLNALHSWLGRGAGGGWPWLADQRWIIKQRIDLIQRQGSQSSTLPSHLLHAHRVLDYGRDPICDSWVLGSIASVDDGTYYFLLSSVCHRVRVRRVY